MANTTIIAETKMEKVVSMSVSLSIKAIAPEIRSNTASILKTLPGYFERLTNQLLAVTAATKTGKEKRFTQTDRCTLVTQLKKNTTKFPVTCAENKRFAQIKVVVSAYPAMKLNSPLIKLT